MGHRPYAVLAYGFDFRAGPAFTGLDTFESPPWLDLDSGYFPAAAERHLLRSIGVPEGDDEDNPFSAYGDQEELVKTRLWVQVVGLGWDSNPENGFLLAACSLKADWDRTVDVGELVVPAGADENLDRAAQLLGLDTAGQRPRWLMTAYYS